MKGDITIDDFITETDTVPDAGHAAWMRKEIEKTLAKDARDEMTYTPLDVVRQKFGV